MKIAIVGARLSGSYASLLLSRMGHEILLLDETVPKEKPCGGGVTAKALRTMPFFHEHPLPHTEITRVRLTTREGLKSELNLRHPIFIFSRQTLDSFLRESAIRSGTRFIAERALGFMPQNHGWVIKTQRTAYEVDFLIGADGATSSVRTALLGKYPASDLSLALGYYLPGIYHPDTVLAVFQERGFQGYLWSFPRVDHSSVGILRWLPQANAGDLRRRTQDFIASHYPNAGSEKSFYAARIPCLGLKSLIRQRVSGQRWALLGDAAGFTDPITAEGIYFALRSAELLAQSMESWEPRNYESAWRNDFGIELQRAASWRDRFYGGTILLQTFTRRVIQMTGHSTTVRRLSDAFISGTCTYQRLRRQLIYRSPRVLLDVVLGEIGRVFAGRGRNLNSEPASRRRLLE